MATIRKRLGKWQVQIRRKNYPNIIKTFTEKSSTDKYMGEIEVLMDREQFKAGEKFMALVLFQKKQNR